MRFSYRNKVCLFFLLINALFVTIVFTLQQVSVTSSTLSIDLPCADGHYGESIEPISIAFTLIFGILLLIQFICMMFHRMSTFLHICAITEVKIRRPRQLKDKGEELSVEKGLTLIKDMQVYILNIKINEFFCVALKFQTALECCMHCEYVYELY